MVAVFSPGAAVATVHAHRGPLADVDRLSALVAAARDGGSSALEELVRRGYDLVFPVCRRVVGNDADAADATQEALVSMVRGLKRFDGRSQFTTWLYRIAVNAAIDELRRRARRPAPRAIDVDIVASELDVESMVASLDVEAALMELPVEQRAAVVLRDLCDLDYAEISQVLQIPPGTVRSRIARGRARLVEILGPTTAGDR